MTLKVADLIAINDDADSQEPWAAGSTCPSINLGPEDLLVKCEDGVAWWFNRDRQWIEVEPFHMPRMVKKLDKIPEAQKQLTEWIAEFWELPDEADLIMGNAIQVDRSGVGHCWIQVSANDLTADEVEQIEGNIEAGEMTANIGGVPYRW